MNALRKLRNNVLSARAVSVLGPRQFVRLVLTMAVLAPKVVRGGDLRPVDRAMGRRIRSFRYRGRRVAFDCAFCDARIVDGSFAFGIAREIYVRDCYFVHQPAEVYERARTVLDIGANRGAFSALMAGHSELVLSIEAQEIFAPVIRQVVASNDPVRHAVEIGFVGSGGVLGGKGGDALTIEGLLDRHGIERVDFVKIDIEGSEFGLFDDPSWLERVAAISMEVHPAFGDPSAISAVLERRGFTCVAADENLVAIAPGRRASFLYAWRRDAADPTSSGR